MLYSQTEIFGYEGQRYRKVTSCRNATRHSQCVFLIKFRRSSTQLYVFLPLSVHIVNATYVTGFAYYIDYRETFCRVSVITDIGLLFSSHSHLSLHVSIIYTHPYKWLRISKIYTLCDIKFYVHIGYLYNKKPDTCVFLIF